jgi:hypothetical protein
MPVFTLTCSLPLFSWKAVGSEKEMLTFIFRQSLKGYSLPENNSNPKLCVADYLNSKGYSRKTYMGGLDGR